MNLRKFHRYLGTSLSPFLLLLSVTGLALLVRKDNLYSQETKKLLVGLHTWEIVAKYTGSFLAIGVLTMVTTGLILTLRPELRRRKRQPLATRKIP
jgi:uncharacterized iron-regulated membrane protein